MHIYNYSLLCWCDDDESFLQFGNQIQINGLLIAGASFGEGTLGRASDTVGGEIPGVAEHVAGE